MIGYVIGYDPIIILTHRNNDAIHRATTPPTCTTAMCGWWPVVQPARRGLSIGATATATVKPLQKSKNGIDKNCYYSQCIISEYSWNYQARLIFMFNND